MLLSRTMFMAMKNPPSLVHSHDFASFCGPYAPEGSRKRNDFVPTLLLELIRHPVFFFLEIKPPGSLPYESKREEADEQVRRRFRDLAPVLTIPTLHGPTKVPQPHVTADVAPISRWDSDVLQPEGANRLKDIIKRVKGMSDCV
ncbi:hypothetical protein V8E53_004694 [Lactarius tabidus]